jgi:hypothetical protein
MAKLRTYSPPGRATSPTALSRQLVAGFLVVSFEPFESRHHDFAGWEPVPVLAWDSKRRENLYKSRLCGCRLGRIPSGENDQVANRCSCVLDALICRAAAMRVA